jgi:hypothetical protein
MHNKFDIYVFITTYKSETESFFKMCSWAVMVDGFTITYAISAYHHLRCEVDSRSSDVYSIQHYSGVHVAQSLVFWVVFCSPLFGLCPLAIVLSVFL